MFTGIVQGIAIGKWEFQTAPVKPEKARGRPVTAVAACLDGLELAPGPAPRRDLTGPLARPPPWWWLRIQSCRPRPADPGRPGLNRLDLAFVGNCNFAGLLLHFGLLRHLQRPQLGVLCQHPMEADASLGDPFAPSAGARKLPSTGDR